VSAVGTHPSAVVTQFTTSCTVELLRLVTSDDIMTSLLKKLSISIKIHVVSNRCGVRLDSVSKLSTESVGSRRELVANYVHTADADVTQLDSCDASSAVCFGHNSVCRFFDPRRFFGSMQIYDKKHQRQLLIREYLLMIRYAYLLIGGFVRHTTPGHLCVGLELVWPRERAIK